MITNREVKTMLEKLQGCLGGYIHAIEQHPDLLDKQATLKQPYYSQTVKDFGVALTMLGDVETD